MRGSGWSWQVTQMEKTGTIRQRCEAGRDRSRERLASGRDVPDTSSAISAGSEPDLVLAPFSRSANAFPRLRTMDVSSDSLAHRALEVDGSCFPKERGGH